MKLYLYSDSAVGVT